MKLSLVTNIPAPYRIPVYNAISKVDLHVFYCSKIEGNRLWQVPQISYPHSFLRENCRALGDGFNFVHNNIDIWRKLTLFKPNIVITTGFNPTHIYAFVWAKVHGVKHICMTDGTVFSESKLSLIHKLARRIFYSMSDAFIAASSSGIDLFRSYGISDNRCFQSHLCADNELYKKFSGNKDRPYDVMFAGQFHERKLPLLFVEIVKLIKLKRKIVRVLLIGDGPMREEVCNLLRVNMIDFDYPGFIQHSELPNYYSRARLLLFTTRMDPWGVVANEAMAAGTPVITTPYAGVAGELVVDGVTGFVCEPDASLWANSACRLLDDQVLWQEFATRAFGRVQAYNYQAAADGIAAACRFAVTGDRV